MSRFRNSLHLISASFEFRNRKDTSQPIDASVVLVSKFAKDTDIGNIAIIETTTLACQGQFRANVFGIAAGPTNELYADTVGMMARDASGHLADQYEFTDGRT